MRLLVACLVAMPALALARDENPGWSYRIENGQERSTRAYLLVADAGQKSQRRIRVRSSCQKPHETEGAYGRCEHQVSVEPSRDEFRLDSGEDVVVVSAKWGAPLLLATLEYGCCGGPWTARFYDERGNYLGQTQGFADTAVGNNAITRSFDFHNRTVARDGRETLLVLGEKAGARLSDMHAITLGAGRSTHAVRLHAGKLGACDDWVVAGFDAFADRNDVLMKLQSGPCELPDQRFSCNWKGDALECAPIAAD
jgi:hypothetical protein